MATNIVIASPHPYLADISAVKHLVVNVKGKAAYDVYAGRGRCPRTGVLGKFGNPFSHLAVSAGSVRCASRNDAVRLHVDWILTQPHLIEELGRLRGTTFGCWCVPSWCHAYTLAKIANARCRICWDTGEVRLPYVVKHGARRGELAYEVERCKCAPPPIPTFSYLSVLPSHKTGGLR